MASYLLGITNSEHVASHPLRGALFESFVIAEFLKHRYHSVKTNNLYYFRDNNGNEVDLVLDYSDSVDTVEIKSGETIHAEFFKGLKYYSKLNKNIREQYLIYGGEKSQMHQVFNIVPYHMTNKINFS